MRAPHSVFHALPDGAWSGSSAFQDRYYGRYFRQSPGVASYRKAHARVLPDDEMTSDEIRRNMSKNATREIDRLAEKVRQLSAEYVRRLRTDPEVRKDYGVEAGDPASMQRAVAKIKSEEAEALGDIRRGRQRYLAKLAALRIGHSTDRLFPDRRHQLFVSPLTRAWNWLTLGSSDLKKSRDLRVVRRRRKRRKASSNTS